MKLLSSPARIAAVSLATLVLSFAGTAGISAHPGAKDTNGCHTPLLTGVEHCHSHDLRRDDTAEDDRGFQTDELDNRSDTRGYEREGHEDSSYNADDHAEDGLTEEERAERRAEHDTEGDERQAERDAEKEERQVEREAEKAEREAEKADRKAEKEAEKAERKAQRDAERAERVAARDAQKAERKAARDTKKAKGKSAKLERGSTKKIKAKGKKK